MRICQPITSEYMSVCIRHRLTGFSLIIDVKTYSPGSMIYHDIWPGMHDAKENLYLKVNLQRIRPYYGKR